VRTGGHPRYRLDEVIHAPVRLSIVSALAAADRADFRYLRELVEVSDSLLSKHMTLLEDAGYVEVTKGYQGKRPRTWYTLTDTGRAAFGAYLAALHEIVGTTASHPPPRVSMRQASQFGRTKPVS
jgi:DNA-binding HxlR family transcriptional regulator